VGILLTVLPLAAGTAAEPAKIAFVDTGNTGRSVTAEALANQMIAQQKLNILVISRAVDMNPYNVVPETFAAEILAKHGLDVSAHRAVQLVVNDITHSDVILTMTAKHRDTILALYPQAAGKVFTVADYAGAESRDVVDAWRQPMAVYEKTFDQINSYMPAILGKASKQ